MWKFEHYGDKNAMIDDSGRVISYKELSSLSDVLVSHIEKGCLVFQLCLNTVESVVGYATFLNHKIVPVMLNAHMDINMLMELIVKYKPTYLWLPVNLVEEIKIGTVEFTMDTYCLLKTNYDETYPLYDDLALLLTTSGSTGSPKFVRQSYDNIRAYLLCLRSKMLLTF